METIYEPPQSSPGDVPRPNRPKRGGAKQIWLWMLLPMGGMLLMCFTWWAVAASGTEKLEDIFWGIFALQCLFSLLAWVVFTVVASRNCRKGIAIMLGFLYPLIQIGVQTAIFFGGCLIVINEINWTWGHAPPENYEGRDDFEVLPDPADPPSAPDGDPK